MIASAANEANRASSASGVTAPTAERGSAAWIDRMTDELMRYPRPYSVLIELPGVLIDGDVDIALDASSRLIRSNVIAKPAFSDRKNQLAAALRSYSLSSLIQGGPGSICLEIKVVGHLDSSESSFGAANAIARAKQLLQLLALSGYGLVIDSISTTARESWMRGNETDRSDNSIEVEIAEDLRSTFGSVKYKPAHRTVGMLGLHSDGDTVLPPEQSITSALQQFSALLRAKESNEDATRILTGLEWAFDASMSRNETQALLSACIGIEAILGKSKETSITEKLADRCAFLLGKGARQRNEISDKFRKIYEVRSEVVHGRSRRLKADQRGRLDDAMYLLHSILRREAAEFPAS
ncbi:HEPN domain-containing protein [Paraburkholderia flagellata]|uniref:HEPN domain-containing protein n=1 Tax=Paraburkholderia flagellata TaxID=2883241 RepID=UPI001F1EE2EC|nr:HEPN domain-containing protein [Paraburkholderia flagellata]